MKKVISLLIVVSGFLFVKDLSAQYRTGVGGYFGNWMGVTVKQYMNTNADQSMEGLLINNNDLWRLTGIYAWNKSVRAPGMQVSGLNWHYGIGLHAGYYNDKTALESFEYGIDAQIGLELLFGEMPFSIGLDLNPFYSIPAGGRKYTGSLIAGGIVLRYLID